MSTARKHLQAPAPGGLESAVPSPSTAKPSAPVSKRRLPGALEKPVGKMLGCVIAALGVLFSLSIFIAGPDLLPWYWEPHAPEQSALVGGIGSSRIRPFRGRFGMSTKRP